LIEIDGLKKSIRGKWLFECPKGFIDDKGLYFVKGKNGCGKSTLMKIIYGKDRNYDGRICNNFDKIVFLPQIPYVFKGDVWFNIILGMNEDEIVKAKKLILKFNLNLNQNAHSLSMGQRQTMFFIRAFARDSHLLILDEPDSFLDNESKRSMINLIEMESKKKAIIIVSHDDYEVDAKYINFEQGQVIFKE